MGEGGTASFARYFLLVHTEQTLTLTLSHRARGLLWLHRSDWVRPFEDIGRQAAAYQQVG
jgi:hypothetical protein